MNVFFLHCPFLYLICNICRKVTINFLCLLATKTTTAPRTITSTKAPSTTTKRPSTTTKPNGPRLREPENLMNNQNDSNTDEQYSETTCSNTSTKLVTNTTSTDVKYSTENYQTSTNSFVKTSVSSSESNNVNSTTEDIIDSASTKLFSTTTSTKLFSTSTSLVDGETKSTKISSTEGLKVTISPEEEVSDSTVDEPRDHISTSGSAIRTGSESDSNTTISTTLYVDVVMMGVHDRSVVVQLCVSIVVVTIVMSVLILFIVLCRRRQRKYEEKYEEMKHFVETHYRNRYI